MTQEHSDTDAFRDARFWRADLRGTELRDCDLRGVRVVSCAVDGMRVDGFDGRAAGVVVDGVDVTEFVQAELDRRHPERVQVREARDADGLRAAWAGLETAWAATVARAERLPEEQRRRRVDREWSVSETLRHLAFAVDTWVGRMVRDDPRPWHPQGLPPTDFGAPASRDIGIDVDADPAWAEVLALWSSRAAQVRDVLAEVTDAVLDEDRTAAPAPAWGEETHSVRACLRTVLHETVQHRRFAERDLARLEAAADG